MKSPCHISLFPRNRKINFEIRGGEPVLFKLPGVELTDSKGENQSASRHTSAAAPAGLPMKNETKL